MFLLYATYCRNDEAKNLIGPITSCRNDEAKFKIFCFVIPAVSKGKDLSAKDFLLRHSGSK